MADNPVKFLLDLDIEQFSESAITAKGMITEIGNPENLSGLLKTLGEVATILAPIAIAAFAFKEAIDLSEQADTINRVNDEFNTLTASAGISSRTLKEGLEQAAGGLVSTNDLLGIANQAIIKMGSSASHLPEIMELARKATAVFGGDVKSNFEGLTTAISNGNVRMLRQYGILVDNKKAIDDFAKAHHIAANELSATGKRQAIMNEALAQGQEKFKNVSSDLTQTVNIVDQFKTTLTEMKEIFVLVFDRTIGPSLKSLLTSVNHVATALKTELTASLGIGLDKNNAQITILEGKISSITKTLEDLKSKKGTSLDLVPADTMSRLQSLPKLLSQYQSQLEELKTKNKELNQTESEGEKARAASFSKSKDDAADDIIDQKARLANKQKFDKQMADMDIAYWKAKQSDVQSENDIEKIIDNQRLQREQAHKLALDQINRSETLSHSQKIKMVEMEEKKYHAEVAADEQRLNSLRTQLINQYVANSENAFQGIGRAAQQMTMQAKAELVDFGKQGQEVMNAFKQNSVSAFEQMGASMQQGVPIAKASASAIKQAFLGMIGDIAIEDGTRIMLSGIFPPNPAALAAGAALIALGGYLKAESGGGATTTSTGAVSTGSGSFTSATNQGVTQTTSNAPSGVPGPADMNSMQTAPQNVVHVNIAGNYLNTDQTQRTLMDLMKQSTNATDFTYNKVGV